MPETVAAAIAWVGSTGIEIAGLEFTTAQILTTVASVYTLRSQQLRQQQAARDAYNASLRDRYVMSRGTAEPRQLVLGRQRVSGPIAFMQSYGADREHLVMVILLAAHEIDAVEAVYINDELAVIDGSGNVTGVQRRDRFTMTGATGSFDLSSDPTGGTVTASVAYGTTTVSLAVGSVTGRTVAVSGGTVGLTGTVTISYQPTPSPFAATNATTDLQAVLTLSSAGAGSVTLPYTPITGSVSAVYIDPNPANGSGDVDLTSLVSVAGPVVSIAGGPPDISVTVTYRAAQSNSRMRIRSHLGAAGQTADAGIISALPTMWTSAHKLTGQAYLVVEADFDSDAFPSGLPNISALVRGAKVYDTRTGTTAWSENLALLLRHAATSSLCGRLDTSLINDTSISAAANVCDTSVSYVVNGQTYTRALYTGGTVYKSGSRPKDLIDDLCLAMAGRWCFVDGQLRVRAGAYVTPLQTLDETWLTGEALQVQARPARTDVFNVTTGKFNDQSNDYQTVDYPRVASSSYITEDGAELPLELNFGCVTFSGQAQQVAAAMMRDARQGARLTVTCNMRAYAVEPFDVLNVTLPRFGWSSKPFEVLDVGWTIGGGIQLQLKETASNTWDVGTSFSAVDPAPNTRLPSPWGVPAVVGLACTSGTAELALQADGTVVSAMRVTWTPITDQYVIDSGGGVEVRYGLASTPESAWRTVQAPQATGQVRLTDVQDGRIYLVKARAYTALVKGQWSAIALHQVVGKSAPPADVSAFTLIEQPQGGRAYYWDAIDELDLDGFVARYCDATLALPWELMTPLWEAARLDRSRYAQTPADGQWTIAIKARDTSGNESANDKRLTILLDSQGFGSPVVTIDAGALGWPGTQTNCGVQDYYLIDPGSLTWDTIPTTWDAWAEWDGPSAGSSIAYQHTLVDVGTSAARRIRAGHVASGSVLAEYQSSTDGITYTSWAAIPSGAVTFRYLRVRWTVTGPRPVLYRAQIRIYS